MELKSDNEKVKIEYPKVVFKSKKIDGWAAFTKNATKEIVFYSEKGDMKEKIKINKDQAVYTSPNKKYILILRVPDEIYFKQGGIIYNNDGKLIWKKEDSPTPITLSDEGYTIAAPLDTEIPPDHGTNFTLYNPNGKKIKIIENPDKKNTAAIFGKFSNNGNYAILCFKACTYPPTVFVLIDKRGNIIWEKELKNYRFSARRGEIIILPKIGISGILFKLSINPKNGKESQKPFAFFIDWNGKLKWISPLKVSGEYQIRLSKDKENIFICSLCGYLCNIEKKSGKLIWEHKEKWVPDILYIEKLINHPWFVQMEILENKIYIAGRIPNEQLKWTDTILFIFDCKTGDLISKKKFLNEKIFLKKVKNNFFLFNTGKRKISSIKIREVRK